MPSSFSLRRSLRSLTSLRKLDSSELDALLQRSERKTYRAGEVLWRAELSPDFLGVIESGEIIIESLQKGAVVRSMRLNGGDHFQPGTFPKEQKQTLIRVRAGTDVILHIVRIAEASLPPKTKAIHHPDRQTGHTRSLWDVLWRASWTLLVLLVMGGLTWRDVSRILSGSVYLLSNRRQATSTEEQTMRLLGIAQQLDPAAFYAYNQQGFLWLNQGDLPKAESAFWKAVSLEQDFSPAYNNLAAAYFMEGQGWRAALQQQKAVQNDPNRAVVQYNLGLILMDQGTLPEAVRAFKEASFIDPTWGLPALQEAYAYLKMQEDPQAERAARAALQKDPSLTSAEMILSIALYNQGRYQESLESLVPVLTKYPDDPVVQFRQALALEKLGESDSALRLLEQLRSTSSDPQTVRRVEAEIEVIQRSLPAPPP